MLAERLLATLCKDPSEVAYDDPLDPGKVAARQVPAEPLANLEREMSLAKFERIVKESGFVVERLKYTGVKQLHFLTKIPGIREFMTNVVPSFFARLHDVRVNAGSLTASQSSSSYAWRAACARARQPIGVSNTDSQGRLLSISKATG